MPSIYQHAPLTALNKELEVTSVYEQTGSEVRTSSGCSVPIFEGCNVTVKPDEETLALLHQTAIPCIYFPDRRHIRWLKKRGNILWTPM